MENRKALILTAGAALVALLAGFVLRVDVYLGVVGALFLLVAAAIVLIVQLERPSLGFALLVGTGVAFPLEFPGPAASMLNVCFPLAAGLCGVWLLRAAARGRLASLDRSRAVVAVLALMATAVLSFTAGQFPWFPSAGAPLPAQVAELALFLLSGCLFLAVGHQLNSMGQLRWLTWILVGAGVVTTVVQMFPALRFIGRLTTRPTSVGSLFFTWLVALSLAQALFNRSLALSTRLALIGVNVMVFYHGLFQARSWASGWVPALVALGVIVLVRLPRLSFTLALAALPIGLFLSGTISGVLMGDEQYSVLTRVEAWRVLWRLIERSPLLGTGMANYYYYTENFPLLGWYVRFIAHNNYQDLLVQTGFLGLLIFCWFAFEVFWMMLRLYRQAPAGFAKAYAVGALGGLAGSLVAGMLGDWIIPFYYNAGILGFRSSLLFWVFLGGALALKRMIAGLPTAEASSLQEAHFFQRGRPALVDVH